MYADGCSAAKEGAVGLYSCAAKPFEGAGPHVPITAAVLMAGAAATAARIRNSKKTYGTENREGRGRKKTIAAGIRRSCKGGNHDA